ncbi:hypothetical protein B2J86_09390 [Acidovorax sp. SRB_14]|nr:hypothetical protein [Acidovorax sp. SRB_14]
MQAQAMLRAQRCLCMDARDSTQHMPRAGVPLGCWTGGKEVGGMRATGGWGGEDEAWPLA